MQKLTELKGETDSSTIIVGDFNTLLSIMDTATRQNIRKKIEDFTTQYNKSISSNICSLYPRTEYTFFSSAHGIFSRTDHRSGQRLSLNRF